MSRQALVDEQRKQRLYEKRIMNNGAVAQVVGYRNSQDIDVILNDRVKIEHISYQGFKNGSIASPIKRKDPSVHIGETMEMANGLTAEIIGYRCVGDIDVKFSDGFVVQHKTYSHFRSGHMGHPGLKQKRTRRKKA